MDQQRGPLFQSQVNIMGIPQREGRVLGGGELIATYQKTFEKSLQYEDKDKEK